MAKASKPKTPDQPQNPAVNTEEVAPQQEATSFTPEGRILDYVKRMQKNDEYVLITPILRLTQGTPRDIKTMLRKMVEAGELEVLGSHQLGAPYWDGSDNNKTKYYTVSQCNIQARLIKKNSL